MFFFHFEGTATKTIKMKQLFFTAILLGFSMFFVACDKGSTESEGNDVETTDQTDETAGDQTSEAATSFEKDGLKVYALEGYQEYPDASLSLTSPERGTDLPSGKNQFSFEVGNYELGQQTPGAEELGMANSAKGQHIHFILNNGPYSAQYEPEFLKEMEDGHYVLLAFLARSYHLSVKKPNAFVTQQFVVGTPEDNYKEADLSAPHMFYSRPKGTYKAGDYDKLLLDFFLVNSDLSADGNKVRATINGTEFTFTKWVPYVIEGLEAGETIIKLEYMDKDGNLIESPFNPVERTVTLEAAP